MGRKAAYLILSVFIALQGIALVPWTAKAAEKPFCHSAMAASDGHDAGHHESSMPAPVRSKDVDCGCGAPCCHLGAAPAQSDPAAVYSTSFRSSPPAWSGLLNTVINVDPAEAGIVKYHDPPPVNRPILQVKSSLLI